MSHYFIGIKVPKSIGQLLKQTQQNLQPHVSYKEWVHQDDFHVTLKFLGNVDHELILTLIEELNRINLSNLMELEVNGLNAFGKPNQPRVLFAEVVPNHTLQALKNEIERLVEPYGFPTENRDFKPHITLAKKWRNNTIASDPRLTQRLFESSLVFQTDAFQVFQIHPSEQPKYQTIAQCQFVEIGDV